MPAKSLDLDSFLDAPGAIIDVRSPAEYAHGRICGAINLPLFSDAERAQIGTTYKRCGHNQAVLQGLEIAGPKLHGFAVSAHSSAESGHVRLYCWRGGMRSGSMAWLLETSGLLAVTLAGGYKTFRRWVLDSLLQPYHLHVLGGLTGSGKTRMLQILKHQGEQVLDLEALASHRGSSFGGLGMPDQPTNEQFENAIAWELNSFDPKRRIWVEDESRMIGSCKVPDSLYSAMRQAPLTIVDKPLDERLAFLMSDYALKCPAELSRCTERLATKLGGAKTQLIARHIQQGALEEAMKMVLDYYDNAYRYGLGKRPQPVRHVEGCGLTDEQWIEKLLL